MRQWLLQVASAQWILNALLKGLPMTGFRWLSLSLMEVTEYSSRRSGQVNNNDAGNESGILRSLSLDTCHPPFLHFLPRTTGWSGHTKIMLPFSLLATLLPFLSPMLLWAIIKSHLPFITSTTQLSKMSSHHNIQQWPFLPPMTGLSIC